MSAPHMGGEEMEFIKDAFQKNWIAPVGENVNGFERDLSEYIGTKYAGAFTSGTASIHLALILLGVGEGDEVICQSFTFAATANPIRYQRATPVFVDSEAETSNIDPNLLEVAIKDRIKKGKKPKAIIVVHLYGMPAKMNQILQIAGKYDIPVIEDAAEALGSSIGNKKCGSFGKLGILSFNGNKIITTSGGGALLGNNSDLIKKARFFATQARDDAPHYEHSSIGYNYRMSNILAGIGRGQMKVLDLRVERRREVYKKYFSELGKTWLEPTMGFSNNCNDSLTEAVQSFKFIHKSPTGLYFLKEPAGYFSNRWLTTIILNSEQTKGVTRKDIRMAMKKENIEVRPLWKPMHLQPVFKQYPNYTNGISNWLFENGLCLPSGSNMTESDQMRVISTIKNALNIG
ncbi:MAG: aminotransferase class I/II-fold pyridoxal phosphate-dependent enzyme [Balneolaceae bacterium]|nr:aminotransferase class I/II-fold pyridoxal phosphate-dependent enzyme [Balneolaceae bacterium]